MLRGLRLQFPRCTDEGQERQVNEDRSSARQLVAELPDRLEEGKPFDIADGAADFDQHEVGFFVARQDEILDGVRHVGNDLHGAAEIISAPLGREDVLVNPARRDVVVAACGYAGEALVMTKIEIGFRAVVGDENLPVLIGAHRPGIDIEVGIELAKPHGIASCLQQRAERRRCQTLT